MTIVTDLTQAIADRQREGIGLAAMTLRMGPGSLRALAALYRPDDAPRDYAPTQFEGVSIKVALPPANGGPPTEDRFHGWELDA